MKPPPMPFDDVSLHALGFRSTVDCRVTDVAGGRVLAISNIDHDEARRRAAAGLGAVVDRPLLETLGGLPLGEPIPWDDVDPLTQVELDSAPAGCVESNPHTVTRLLTAVLDPAMFVAGFDGIRSVRQISLFAADARRLLVGGRRPSSAVTEVLRRCGIGFAVRSGDKLDLIERPTACQIAPGPRRWFVQERLWDSSPQLMAAQALR